MSSELETVALAFAKALVEGNFTDAHKLLTPQLRQQYPAARLENEYQQMIAYVGKITSTDVELVQTINGSPDGLPDDVGWAYVSISGPHENGGGWGEGVSVVVSKSGDEPLIREIIWGRP